jgi:hypothetical protein
MNILRILVRLALAVSATLGPPASSAGAEPAPGKKTALDEYVAKADPTYEWKVV